MVCHIVQYYIFHMYIAHKNYRHPPLQLFNTFIFYIFINIVLQSCSLFHYLLLLFSILLRPLGFCFKFSVIRLMMWICYCCICRCVLNNNAIVIVSIRFKFIQTVLLKQNAFIHDFLSFHNKTTRKTYYVLRKYSE